MINYKNISTVTAIITMLLFVTLLVAPGLLLSLFQVEHHASAFFVARRAAVLFLGLFVICWASRESKPSSSRQAICLGLVILMVAMTVLGVVEYVRGSAGAGIFIAIVVEIILAVAYGLVWSRTSHQLDT